MKHPDARKLVLVLSRRQLAPPWHQLTPALCHDRHLIAGRSSAEATP